MKELSKNASWRNVGAAERWASVLGGGAMIAYAFKQRGTAAWAMGITGGALAMIGLSGYCPVYAAAGLDTTGEEGIEVDRSVMINRDPDEIYEYWRRLETLPTIMEHLVSVTVLDKAHSHWVARAPAGRMVEWDAEITADEPNRKIAWRSMPESDVQNEGTVTFEEAPGMRGTVVRVRLRYVPPAGIEGAFIARLMGEEPAVQLEQDLRRLKQMMETGEAPTTKGQSHGRIRKRQNESAFANRAA